MCRIKTGRDSSEEEENEKQKEEKNPRIWIPRSMKPPARGR